jgi:Fe-S oxidoreductase
VPLTIGIGLGITVVMFAIAGRRFFWLFRLITAGQPAPDRFKDLPSRLKVELVEVGGQKKLLKWTLPGMAHAFTFWGFTILILTIIEAYGALFQRDFHIPLIGTWSWIGFLEDFFAVAVLVSLLVFTAIRVKNSPKREGKLSRFFGSHTRAAWLVLLAIAGVIISLLLYRAGQVNTGNFSYTDWAFASHGLAALLHPLGSGVNSVIYTVALLANVAIITGFLVFVSYSKHLHIFLAPINVATSRRPRALGALASTPDMTMEGVGEEDEVVFGAGRVEDFSWKQLLDLATCTECGRCQSQCPAWNTGKPLSPKLLIMDLRDNMFANADRVMAKNRAAGTEVETLVPTVIDPDVLWSCTNCGACVEECPVDIEHIDTIIDMRRYEVLIESRFPTEAGLMLRNVENQGDPWGLGAAKREDWIASLDFEVPVVTDTIPADIEYLYWVGCAGALDERARKGAQATARMLHRAGVSFAILGKKESCTGDPVRRLGNEYLFQEQAQANIATLEGVGAKKIIATCPHCFNTLSNEYPALGGNFEVIHHSQLLEHLVATGKLTPGGGYQGTVTYHDPCFLGRHNRVFDEPRSVIDSIPGATQVEMGRCREKGFCCGAGGARMWLEENIGKRVNMERTEEALGTGADVVSTACPYCMIMLDDAVRAHQKEDDVRVLDLSQLLEESLGEPVSVGAPAPDTLSPGETGEADDGPVEPG